VTASDPDGDTLIYSASGLPSGATFNTTTHTFAWTPSTAGTYPNIQFNVTDGKLTTSEKISITVSANQPSNTATGGGGGGVIYGYGGSSPGRTNLEPYLSSSGIFNLDAYPQDETGKAILKILKGTRYLSKEGLQLKYITIKIVSDAQILNHIGRDYIVGSIFELGPDGATFDPSAFLTLSYDGSTGLNESDLVIACWEPESEKWIPLENAQIDVENKTVTVPLHHFSVYAIIVQSTEPPGSVLPLTDAIKMPETVITSDIKETIGEQLADDTLISIGPQQLPIMETTPEDFGGSKNATLRLSILAIALGIAALLGIATAIFLLRQRRKMITMK
jgi:hypothetical protein